MGEVIEIVILTTCNSLLTELHQFLKSYIKKPVLDEKIKVMDNWYYENSFELESMKMVGNYLEAKIITVTNSSQDEQIGVYLEKNVIGYEIQGWINPNKEFTQIEYKDFINAVSKFISNKEIIICGIGKEIYVDFNNGINVAVKKAHNVDWWLVSQKAFYDSGLDNIAVQYIIL